MRFTFRWSPHNPGLPDPIASPLQFRLLEVGCEHPQEERRGQFCVCGWSLLFAHSGLHRISASQHLPRQPGWGGERGGAASQLFLPRQPGWGESGAIVGQVCSSYSIHVITCAVLYRDCCLKGVLQTLQQLISEAGKQEKPVCLVIDGLSVLLSVGVPLCEVVLLVQTCTHLLTSTSGPCQVSCPRSGSSHNPIPTPW